MLALFPSEACGLIRVTYDQCNVLEDVYVSTGVGEKERMLGGEGCQALAKL